METKPKATPSAGVRVWKPGDRVIMNGNYFVHPGYRNRIWTVASDPFMVSGSMCVKLRDYHGAYASDGLSPAPGTEDGENGGGGVYRENGGGEFREDGGGGESGQDFPVELYSLDLNTSRVFIFCHDGMSFGWTDSGVTAARAVDLYQKQGFKVKSCHHYTHTVYDVLTPEGQPGSVQEDERHDAADWD